MPGESGGCLTERPGKCCRSSLGRGRLGWVESGKAAGGRRTLKDVWALSMPRCTGKLSWQRRPHRQRYGGRSLQYVSRKQSLVGDEVSQILWSQTQKVHSLTTWFLGSHCRFRSCGGAQWGPVLGRQSGNNVQVNWKKREWVLEVGRHPRRCTPRVGVVMTTAADTGCSHGMLFLSVGPRAFQIVVS